MVADTFSPKLSRERAKKVVDVPVPAKAAQLPGGLEAFLEKVIADFQDCVVVLLTPWTDSKLPPHVVAPVTKNGLLDEDKIAKATANRHTVLIPCTFEDPEEEVVVGRFVPQFMSCEHICVFMLQFVPPTLKPGRETNAVIMNRHDAMMSIGVDDVILYPQCAPLDELVALARASWELNLQKMQMMLQQEPEAVTVDAMSKLKSQHGRLLWESIPRALMPHFKSLDRSVVETSVCLGRYQLVKRFETHQGTVLQAMDKQGTPCAIKVFDKAKVHTPGELEGIYREYRFLSSLLHHPNVARCTDMVHSSSRVYLVLDFAGPNNLAQAVSSRPRQRFDGEDALQCFEQIVRGLAHCHSRDVNHRNLALEHVVLAQAPGGKYHCTIVDFYCAMVSRGDTKSNMICGNLPCIAPEMALGKPYTPRLADCWSAGVLLLEMGGGLSSLHRSVSFDVDSEPHEIGVLIRDYFMKEGSPERALACIGEVRHSTMAAILNELLKTEPEERMEAQRLLGKYWGG